MKAPQAIAADIAEKIDAFMKKSLKSGPLRKLVINHKSLDQVIKGLFKQVQTKILPLTSN